MKRSQIFIALLLLLPASCTDDAEHDEQNSRDFRITASIEDNGIASRVADRNDRTSFTENDEIFIGWDGSASYKYLCSGVNNVFVPNATDADRGLWSDLLHNTSTTVEVYAWYGTMSSSLPAVDATISIPQDQTSESKLLSAICMAARKSVSPTTNALDFSFHHLTARLFLSVDIVDDAVTQTDVMDAAAQISHIYADGTITTDVSGEYQLSVISDDKAGKQSIRMKRSWSDQEIYHLDFECLLPPQTLGAGQNIIITLANGKEYVCKISNEITLQAGQKMTLSAELKASGDASFKPKLTTIPNATNSAFSGNRLICAIKDASGEYRYRVYDKQPDGSWGEGVLVYEDEAGTIEFPTQTYSNILKRDGAIEMSGDYVVLGTNADNNSLYFIKKSKKTGKWYCANGRLQGRGYGVCISEDFLVGGNHVSSAPNAGRSYIYPIDENGELGPVQDTPKGIGAYKCSIYGGVLATNTGVYRYNADKGEWESLPGASASDVYGNTRRVATDGKRVILQNGSTQSDVYIYNVETGKKEEWEGATAKAHQSKPIAIYGNYALAGRTDGIDICYRDPITEKWSIINPDGGFLEMMKHWAPRLTITTISGENLSMKGPRAMIVDAISSQSFFIENIDKMVDDYLADPY